MNIYVYSFDKPYKIFASDFILYKSKYKNVGVLPIRIIWSNVLSIGLRQRETENK